MKFRRGDRFLLPAACPELDEGSSTKGRRNPYEAAPACVLMKVVATVGSSSLWSLEWKPTLTT